MLALYRAGRQAEALRTYQSARAHLAAELGIEPGRSLTRLEEQILLQDPELDLPEHDAAAPNNLPTRIGRIIGRAEDLVLAGDRLAGRRLLTITGPAGVGKTTLALEVARSCNDRYSDGAWLIPLETLTEANQVAEAVGAALRRPLRVEGANPEEAFAELIAQLSDDERLLVIDNCEHLVDEAARVVQRILEKCPRVSVLATSRERLMVPGEGLLPLAPFEVGTRLPPEISAGDAVSRSSALQLFQDRAQALDPSFVIGDDTIELALRICRRLDGLPLAIELAASQVGLLTLSEIDEQMNGRFELLRAERAASKRHQTLEAAIGWSYELLDPEDQRLLERLATIRTPFTSSLAAGLAGRVDGPSMFRALRRLRDQSMLQVKRNAVAQTQYELLQSIRAFALTKAVERGQADEDLEAHANAFLQLARHAHGRTLGGSAQVRWLTIVKEAAGDFEQAIDTFIRNEEPGTALEICSLIGWVWLTYRHQEQGYRVVNKALGSAPESPDRALARVHIIAAGLLLMDGVGTNPDSVRNAEIQDHLSAAAAMSNAIDDVEVHTEARVWDGYHHWYMGECGEALEILVPIRDTAAEHGYDRALMFANLGIGGALNLEGATDEAVHHIQRALGLAQSSGDGYVQCMAYTGVGTVLRNTGEFAAAMAAYHSGYLVAARYGFPMYASVCAAGEAMTQWIDGQEEQALEAVRRALAVASSRPLSDGFRSFQNLMGDPEIGLSRDDLAARLRAIFAAPGPDRRYAALHLLLELLQIHAETRGLDSIIPSVTAALALLPASDET